MNVKKTIIAGAILALFASIGTTQAHDENKYPNLKGQWTRDRTPIPGGGQTPFDPTRPVAVVNRRR